MLVGGPHHGGRELGHRVVAVTVVGQRDGADGIAQHAQVRLGIAVELEQGLSVDARGRVDGRADLGQGGVVVGCGHRLWGLRGRERERDHAECASDGVVGGHARAAAALDLLDDVA